MARYRDYEDDYEQDYRPRRATVARSALDVIAMVFIGCAFCFWGVVFWQLLTPPAPLSLGTVSVLVLTVVYSLAAPLLLSMLVPTTPAGQMLQKTQWATVGFPVIVAAALFLCWQGYTLISAWFSAQGQIERTTGLPILVATNQVTPMAISLTIAFILIPALAWIQVSPQMWMQQIQQAHQVKKLEMQQRGELAIIKASILSAERKALLGWANLLPLEQQEVMQTIRGLIMAQSDTQRDIVRTLGLGAELERDIMDDREIADRMDYVAQRINVLPDVVSREAPEQEIVRMRDLPPPESQRVIDQAFDRAIGPSGRAEAAPVTYTETHQSRDAGRVAVRQGNAPHDEAYTLAYDQLSGGAWTVRELAELLDVAESTARDIRIRWTHAGLVSGQGLPNGRYSFTERGGA